MGNKTMPTDAFLVSSIHINTSDFPSTVIFLVLILGLKIKALKTIGENIYRLYLTSGPNSHGHFPEIVISNDPEAAKNNPVQIGLQSSFCSLSDTLNALSLFNLETESIEEANKRLDSDYPENIRFKDPRLNEFFIETRPLYNIDQMRHTQEIIPSSSPIDVYDYLALMNIATIVDYTSLVCTDLHSIVLLRPSISEYVDFFSTLGFLIDSYPEDTKEFARFDSHGYSMRIEQYNEALAWHKPKFIFCVTTQDLNGVNVVEILKNDIVKSISSKYHKGRYSSTDDEKVSMSLSIKDKTDVCWSISSDIRMLENIA
jgi:hypothetical protein